MADNKTTDDSIEKIGRKKGNQLLSTRLAVIQTLYSEHLSQKPHRQQFAWLDEEQHQEVDEGFYQQLLDAVHKHDEAMMVILPIALDKRKWENFDVLYQRLLMTACAEMMAELNENSLVISLYCRISDSFYDDNMAKFTNAVLQNCASQIAGTPTVKP